MDPAEPSIIHMFVNESNVWLYLAAAQLVSNLFTTWLTRVGRKTAARRVKAKRAPRTMRHAAPVKPWRGEIARTMALPVVTEAFPANLAEGW